MPSRSLRTWQVDARKVLDEFESAHRTVGGNSRGRRFARQQISLAYVVLLSSQFQRFCRDLHDECLKHFVRQPALQQFEPILHARFVEARKLDAGNPNPGNIGSDFARLGIEFWLEVRRLDPRNRARQDALESLNRWRNAIAHQDFRRAEFHGRRTVRLTQVRGWRRACDRLAMDMERVMHAYLLHLTGSAPW